MSLARFVCLWFIVGVGSLSWGQQQGSFRVAWLTGEQGTARAGVAVAMQSTAGGAILVRDGTTAVTPDGKTWDLSTPSGFADFLVVGHGTLFTIISPVSDSHDAAVGDAITGLVPVNVRINTRADLMSGKTKTGTRTIRINVSGFLGLTSRGPTLLPVSGFYSALGGVTTSLRGPVKHEETTLITGAVLGFMNGRLTLGMRGSGESGRVTFALPDFAAAATDQGSYRGQILAVDNFGFADIARCWDGASWHISRNPLVTSIVAVETEANKFIRNGDDQLLKNDYTGAIASYNQALRLKPDLRDPYVYSNRAVAKAMTNDLEGSIADSTKATRLSSTLPGGYENLGMAQQVMCDSDSALASFSRLLELAAGSDDKVAGAGHLAVNYYRRCVVKAQKKDSDGAIEDCDRAIQMAPNYGDAYNSRSSLRQAKGDLEGAKADRDKALELKPK